MLTHCEPLTTSGRATRSGLKTQGRAVDAMFLPVFNYFQ